MAKMKKTRKEGCGHCSCEKEKNEELKAYFCPRCKSTKVKPIQGWRNAFGILPRWHCDNCGYENLAFPIIAINKNKLKKKR